MAVSKYKLYKNKKPEYFISHNSQLITHNFFRSPLPERSELDPLQLVEDEARRGWG